jgi:hypothetical protein
MPGEEFSSRGQNVIGISLPKSALFRKETENRRRGCISNAFESYLRASNVPPVSKSHDLRSVHRAMLRPLVPPKMHREDEDTIAFRTGENTSRTITALRSLRLRFTDTQHAPDRPARSGGMRFLAMRAKRASSLSWRANFAESLMPIVRNSPMPVGEKLARRLGLYSPPESMRRKQL